MIFAGRCLGEFDFMERPYPAAVLQGEFANRLLILNEVKNPCYRGLHHDRDHGSFASSRMTIGEAFILKHPQKAGIVRVLE